MDPKIKFKLFKRASIVLNYIPLKYKKKYKNIHTKVLVHTESKFENKKEEEQKYFFICVCNTSSVI